jgi:prepilin-type N-terminal cleavage/methylation domain-containing protein
MKGMSLIEVMMVVALLGGLSLVAAQLMKNQNQMMTQTEAKSEELELYNQIRTILSRKEACEYSFQGQGLDTSVSTIKNATNQDAFAVGNIYGQRNLEITRIDLNNDNVPSGGGYGEAILEIETKRLKKKEGQKIITKEIMLQVQTDSSDNVVECFSESSNTVKTAKDEMCQSLGGTFDQDNNLCDLSDAQIQAEQYCIDDNCRTSFEQQTCPDDQVMKGLNSDGSLICEDATTALDCKTESASLSNTNQWSFYNTVKCSSGYIATGGGIRPGQQDDYRVSHSYPVGNDGWHGYQRKDSNRGTVYVRCCKE